MLVAFFKSHDEMNCKCEIVKFVDRIWVERSGDIRCLRTFIVHVKPESPRVLESVRMLTGFNQIPDLEDLSSSCIDNQYLFNDTSFSTGGYAVNSIGPEGEFGIVDYDFFKQVTVHTTGSVKSFRPPNMNTHTVISVEFKKHPVEIGEFRLIRFSFKITSQLDKVFPRVYNFCIKYFDYRPNLNVYELLDIKNLEIPAVKIYDKKTRQGGFDIQVYLPENLLSTNFNSNTQTMVKHLPDGTISDKKIQKFIWRARLILPDHIEKIKSGNEIDIEGLINDPFELEEIRKGGKKNLHISIFALIIASISLCIGIVGFKTIWAWICSLI